MEMATFVLLGLRYEESVLRPIFEGVQEMEESTTYQAILRKGQERGRCEGVRETLLLLGTRKFGSAAPEGARVAIEAITDPARLAALTERILDVNTWDELLAG